MRPVRRARGEDDGALSGSPPEPGQERARGPTCLLLLACAPARLRSWPEVARRAPAGDLQPPLGVGPGPQSPVSGPGRPGGQEQALLRTVTGMDSPFPCPQDFISPCHQTPCGTDIPTPLFAAECVTKGARGARAPRPVGSRHSGLRFRFRVAAAGCQARGPRGAARLPQRGGRREQSACARGWAGPKAKETA